MWAIPAIGHTGGHAAGARERGRNASNHANPRSLLSVGYLPKGPKNQLAPGRGQTRRLRSGPTHVTPSPVPRLSAARAVRSISNSCTLPSAPGSPSATGGANQASISWTAANGNGSTITAYVVTAINGSTPENAEATPGSATSATLSGLANGPSYTFSIFAQSACGNGPAATTGVTDITGTSSTYASDVIALAPDAYFRLGDQAGSPILADSSGHGLLATFDSSGNTLGVAGALASDSDTAVTDGSGQWVGNVPGPVTLPVANQPRTVEAWVKPSDANCRFVLGYGNPSYTSQSFNLGECGNDVALGTTNDDLYWRTPEPLTDGSWHMITVSYNGTSATAYEDGTSLGTKTFSTPLSTSPGGLALGSWANQCCANFAYGGLDEEAVYPTALSAAQVSTLFAAAGLGAPTTPGSPSASSTTANTATVKWTASTAPGTSVLGYVVSAIKGTTYEQSIAAPGSATTVTLTGLPSGTNNYTFTVTAQDAYGQSAAATTTTAITVNGSGTTYASAILASKPLAFYRLDEPSGSALAADSSGKDHTALYASSAITQGVAGPLASDPATATDDTTAGNYIADYAGNSGLPTGNATRTLMAWVKPNDTNCRYFMGYGGNSYSYDEMEVGNCYNAVIVRLQSDDLSFYSARNIADGAWHLITVVSSFSATTGINTISAYLDSQKLGSQASATPNTAGGSGLDIGNGPTDCCYYGSVADAAVFSSAFSSSKLASLLTAAGDGVPNAPTNVQATGAANKATVTWTAATAPGATVTSNVVTEYANGVAQQSLAVGGSATSATIDSLPLGTNYSFKVVAYDTYGAGAAGSTSGNTSVGGSTTTYAGQTIAAAPAVYYRLGETGTTLLADSSGHNVVGSYDTGGITQGISGAIQDGSDLAASMDSSFLAEAGGTTLMPAGDSDRTVEAWIKPSDGYCDRAILGFGYQTTDQGFTVAECPYAILVDAYNDTHWFYTPRTLDDGAWHFIAVTYTDAGGADQLTVYLDGKSLGTQSFANTLLTSAESTLWIGGGPSDCCYAAFYGGIDEVAVFPTALSATTIAGQMKASLNGPPAAAPSGLTVSPSTNSVTVSWTAPSSPNPITDYTATAYFGHTEENSVSVPGTSTSATIGGLPAGTGYTVKVVAYDAYGASPTATSSPSVTVSGTAGTYSSAVLADAPVAYYRLSDASNAPYAADSSGQPPLSGNGVIPIGNYNSSVTTWGVTGAIPNDPSTAVSDNGGDSVAYNATEDTALPAANQPRTMVAWVKLGDANCRYAMGYGADTTDQSFGMYVCPNSIGVIGWSDDHYFASANTLNDGNWHMVAITFDGTNINAYVDGQSLGAAQQFSGTLNTPFDTTLYLGGGANDAGNRWYGDLAQEAVFPTALSAAQVSALFTASGYSVPSAPSNVQVTPGTNQAMITWNAATAQNTSVTGYVVTAMAGGTAAQNAVATSGTQTSVTLYGLKGQSDTFRVVAYDPYGGGPSATSGSVSVTGGSTFASTVIADGADAYYRLGEATGTLAADSSGFGGIADYDTATTNLGQPGALPHDANETSIENHTAGDYDAVAINQTNTLPTGNAARSMMIWLKPIDQGCDRWVMGYGAQSTAEGFGMGECAQTGNSSLYFHGWGDDLTFSTGSTNLDDGNWHFAVFTYDGAGHVTAYIDGTSLGTQTLGTTTLATPAETPFYIGASVGNYGAFYGYLQDAAIFPTALSSTQVSALYAAR